MDKTKAKNDGKTLSSRSFIGLWAGCTVVLWMALWTFFSVGRWGLSQFGEYYPFAFNMLAFLFGTTALTLIVAHFQRRIGARHFKTSMGGWEFVSVLGVLVSLLIFDAARPTNLLVSTMTLLMPMAFVQTAWLWRYVKTSWLWLLTNLIGVTLFTIPFLDYDPLWDTGILPFFVLLLGLIQGAIQASAMRYLWTRPQSIENRKTAVATQERFDQERMNRLEEHAANGTFEAFEDEPVTQYEGR